MTDDPRPRFDDARRLAWLRLWRSDNIGPRTFDTLLRRYGSAEAALDALPDLLRRVQPGRSIKLAAVAAIEREMERAARIGASFICRDEAGYPPLLREIDSAPAVICVRGRRTVLDRPAVAIVGSRNASAAGLAFAERLTRGLAEAGYVVVSGFARGIDAQAHRAALANGTIAVLAGGHERIYPADQGPFLEKLLEDGLALTEMPLDWEARGRDFPRRNRIVSGLCLGVVVVEAARRSGSLITARFAADQGREVFAVPGSPLDPRAEGTNDLIRDGATFCTGVEDVLRALADRKEGPGSGDLFADTADIAPEPLWDELDLDAASSLAPLPAPVPSQPAAAKPGDLFGHLEEEGAAPVALEGPPVARVAAGLGPAPVSLDDLARAVGLPVRDVRGAVLELEIAGRIERHGGGLVSLLMRP